jgi:phosphoheptose isomerase
MSREGTTTHVTGVVLAGGFGTRLRPVLSDRPKVLAEVNGRPFLFILLDQLAGAGVHRIVLCTGHLGDQVRAAVGDSYRGLPILYSHEDSPLGTGGAVRQAFDNYPDDVFLAVNGDSYVAADLAAFRRSHEASGKPGSLLLTWVDDCARFGTVETAEDGRIQQFAEKRGIAEPGWINAGIYMVSHALLESMPARAPLSIERDVFPCWLQRGLGSYRVHARFIDIGTPESLASAALFFQVSRGLARKRFVIVDRDGTIIVEKKYLSSPDQVELLPNAAAGLKRLREMGLGIVIISNQSGVGRGYFGMNDVERVNARVSELLAEAGASVDGIYICPHTPDERCCCRKPQIGLITQAAHDFGFNPADAFVIGDKACDIDLGRHCGATTFLVETGYGREHLANGWATSDLVVKDLAEAADCINAIRKDDSMETLAVQNLVIGAEERLRKHVLGSITTKQRLLEQCEAPILTAAETIASSMAAGGKMLLCGNGGSAADCQHLAAEMVSVLNQSFLRPGLAAIAMTTDSSILTASANDFGFDGIFERQVQALGKPGDVVVGISTSGNSENVARALSYASGHGMRTISLTGASAGRISEIAEIAIRVPSTTVQHIQEAHITIGHILCDLVERTLFPAKV